MEECIGKIIVIVYNIRRLNALGVYFMTKSKKKKVLIIIFIILAVGIIGAGVVKAVNKQDKGAFVNIAEVGKEEKFTSEIVCDGIIKSREQQNVISSLPYTISEVSVKEGDVVSEGDVLAKLDTSDLEYKIKIAEIDLAIEKERLKSLEEGLEDVTDTFDLEKNLENAKLTYKNAKKKYENSKELLEAGAVSELQLQSDNLAMITAKNNLEIAENKIKDIENNEDKTTNDIKTNIELQKKNVNIKELNLKSQKEALEKSIIKSPMDGTIVLSNAKVGIPASSLTPMFTIDDTDNLNIEVSINEYDINSIEVGQRATITGEAFKKHKLKGEVSYIAPVATVIRSSSGQENNIKVQIDIINPNEFIKPGFSAEVNINTNEKKDALVVPYEVLYKKKDGSTVVFKAVDNKAKEVPVELGIEGDLKVELISSELAEGDVLILNPNENTKDGMLIEYSNKGDSE